jgi:signal transduction histidine kinase
MRTLRARLTLSYTLLFATMLALVGLAIAYVAFDFLVRPILDAQRIAVAQVRALVAANPGVPIHVLRAKIVATATRPGVVVHVSEHRGAPHGMPGMEPGPPGPPGFAGAAPPPDGGPALRELHRQGRGLGPFALGWLFGVHPEAVPAGDGVIFILPDLHEVAATATIYLEALALALLVAVVAAWAIARWIAAQTIAPLTDVTDALERFATGDFEPRPVATTDRAELGALTDAYNAAAAQVASAFEERHHVEEYMRRFVADAGHELRTPLAVLRAYIEILRKGGVDDPALRDRAFKTLSNEMNRMHELTERLIALARLERPEPPQATRVDLAAVARAAIDVATTVRSGDVALVAPEQVWVFADEAEVHEAIGNLVDNALKYARGHRIVVDVRAEDDRALARVRDDGPGIDPDDRAHIFERFYRGQGRGEIAGSGLGLAITARAAERAGGRVVLESAEPGATTFALDLPLAPAHNAAVAP